jgi:uncharacterized protein YraI
MKRTIVILLSAFLLLASGLTVAQAADGPSALVSANRLNVRQGPGTGYSVIATARAGDNLPVTGQDAAGAWYQVSLADGRTGWVSSSYAQLSGEASGIPVVDAPAAATTKVAAGTSRSAGHIIVFQTSSGGAIYAVNPDGTNLRYLTNGMDPALSPDGRQVAFTRWDNQSNGSTGSLWVINVDGTGERQVMGGANQPKSPTWSSDGKQIVINMQQGGTLGNTWLCLVNGKRTEVPQPIPGARCVPQRADPNWALRVVDVASSSYEDLPHSTHSFAPTWDPANAWHVVYRGDGGLMSLDLNQKTTWVLLANGAQRAPVFSPDGKKIATTFKQNDHWEVHVMNADGTGEVRLTDTPNDIILAAHLAGQDFKAWNNAAPAWSPDGSQIAFVTDRNGPWEIWVMNADGSGQHPLLPADTMAKLNLQYQGVDERVISWR